MNSFFFIRKTHLAITITKSLFIAQSAEKMKRGMENPSWLYSKIVARNHVLIHFDFFHPYRFAPL